jgi:hypothetical protein
VDPEEGEEVMELGGVGGLRGARERKDGREEAQESGPGPQGIVGKVGMGRCCALQKRTVTSGRWEPRRWIPGLQVGGERKEADPSGM